MQLSLVHAKIERRLPTTNCMCWFDIEKNSDIFCYIESTHPFSESTHPFAIGILFNETNSARTNLALSTAKDNISLGLFQP